MSLELIGRYPLSDPPTPNPVRVRLLNRRELGRARRCRARPVAVSRES